MLAMAATKGLIDHLFMAGCEWFLMFWVFIEATLAYSLTKFARYCDLQIPCLLCSRIDHVFEKEHGSKSYFHLFCSQHQLDISYLIYCNLHNDLVDVREMCEDCMHSQPNLGRSSGLRTCSCCQRRWKSKSSVIEPHIASKATTKPPLPRVGRRGRSRRDDNTRRMRNKLRNRRKGTLSPGGYSDANMTSDSEFEFLFSEDDDGSYKLVGTGGANRSKILGRHSYSTPDLGSAILLEAAQLNQSLRTRSASLTPNCSVGHGLAEFKMTPNVHRRRAQEKHKKPSSRNKMFSRHSYSTSNLHSALLQDPNNVPRRSVSVTPKGSNTSSGYNFEEFKNPKFRSSMKRTGSYGHVDDSYIPRNTVTQNHNNIPSIPRRHSYSVFQLGCEILLNMPNDEGFAAGSNQSGSFNYDFQDRNFDFTRIGVGSLDDSNVSRANRYDNHTAIPRRHSYSFFEMGCEILLNMPNDESFTQNTRENPKRKGNGGMKPSESLHNVRKSSNDSSRWGQNGHKNPRRHSYSAMELGCALLLEMQMDEPVNRRSASVTPDVREVHGLGEQNKTKFQKRTMNHSHKDDSHVSRRTINHHRNNHHTKLPRRHSYSVFQLGGDILLNTPPDGSLTSHPAFLHDDSPEESQTSIFQIHTPDHRSHHNGIPAYHPPEHMSHHHGMPPHHLPEHMSHHHGVPPHHPPDHMSHHHGVPPHHPPEHRAHHNGVPAHPQYHPHSHHNGVPLHPVIGEKDKNSLPDLSNAFLDKNKWRGSMDDSVVSRSRGSQNESIAPRRHSYSTFDFDLGRALLIEMRLDESLKRSYASPAPNSSIHQSEIQNKPNPGSFDDFFLSHQRDNQNQDQDQGQNPRRHSYSAFELGCALLLDMHLDESSRRRSASVTPGSLGPGYEEQKNSNSQTRVDPGELPQTHPDFSMTSVYKHQGTVDDSFDSHGKGNRKRYRNLVRNSYSTSDLTSPFLEMHIEESVMSKSLTPSFSVGHGLGDLNGLKFQAGSSHSEFGYLDASDQPHRKRKKNDRQKGKNVHKPVPSGNNGIVTNSGNTGSENIWYESFDDSASYDGGRQQRYQMFSRNSQSATDLGSMLLEMHLDDSVRNRSKSLTPNFSIEEDNWSKPQIKPDEKPKTNDHREIEKDKKSLPPMYPTKEMDSSSTNNRADMCSVCSDKMDLRSLDGSTYSEIDGEGLERVKRKAEDDVRCMRLLQSELEAERNAATVAANHAMNMITRLQQEKAALQMEALQYLRMMEEQAEYDMEALQKSNELVEDKENEIQDLLEELEQYRIRYGDIFSENVHVPVIILEDEKRYILESLSTLEKKLHQFSNGDENSFSDGVYENVDQEVWELREKIEGLQADINLVKHACSLCHTNEGLEYVQEITHQLQDLRRSMFDKRYISSN